MRLFLFELTECTEFSGQNMVSLDYPPGLFTRWIFSPWHSPINGLTFGMDTPRNIAAPPRIFLPGCHWPKSVYFSWTILPVENKPFYGTIVMFAITSLHTPQALRFTVHVQRGRPAKTLNEMNKIASASMQGKLRLSAINRSWISQALMAGCHFTTGSLWFYLSE